MEKSIGQNLGGNMKSVYRSGEGKVYRAFELTKEMGKNAARVSLALSAVYVGNQALAQEAPASPPAAEAQGAQAQPRKPVRPGFNPIQRMRKYSELSKKEFDQEMDGADGLVARTRSYQTELVNAVRYRGELATQVSEKKSKVAEKLPVFEDLVIDVEEPQSTEELAEQIRARLDELQDEVAGEEQTPSDPQNDEQRADGEVDALYRAAWRRVKAMEKYMLEVVGEIKYLLTVDTKLTEKMKQLGLYTKEAEDSGLEDQAAQFQPWFDRMEALEQMFSEEGAEGQEAEAAPETPSPQESEVAPEAPATEPEQEAPVPEEPEEEPEVETPVEPAPETPSETKVDTPQEAESPSTTEIGGAEAQPSVEVVGGQEAAPVVVEPVAPTVPETSTESQVSETSAIESAQVPEIPAEPVPQVESSRFKTTVDVGGGINASGTVNIEKKEEPTHQPDPRWSEYIKKLIPW